MLEKIGLIVQVIAGLFLFGLIVDYPEQRRKKRRKQKEENGKFNDRY